MPDRGAGKSRPSRTDPAALIARLSAAAAGLREREVVAPLLPRGRLRVRLEGLVQEFVSTRPFAGWGRFRPVDERRAEPLGEALPWHRDGYLALFPALRVVLLWPDEGSATAGVWWALPFNAGDARRRFGFDPAEPVPVFLCDPAGGAGAFERVIARVDGRVLWFDSADVRADPQPAQALRDALEEETPPERLPAGLTPSQRLAFAFAQIHRVGLDHRRFLASHPDARRLGPQGAQDWLREATRRSRLEQQLRHALQKADAMLLSFHETAGLDGLPGDLVVEWRPNRLDGPAGAVAEDGGPYRLRYRSRIEPNLTVASSGICLSGRDGDFDLTSLVNVMTEAGSHGMYDGHDTYGDDDDV